MPDKVEVLVDGGKATPGPPLGPALGPLGINIVQVVKVINEKTKAFEGMKVPVKVIVEKDKSFTVEVGTPPTTALIKKELGLEKGSSNARESKVGDLKMEQVVRIAEMKEGDLLGKDLREKVSEILGTCVSMGVTVEGKDPREVQAEIYSGKYELS
ncbi:MAG: 50S ribosomal protein L11 [Thermoprotei archaeon]|nr:MAG: 50S ribosomal protein L11 [Thermoprotei archaeon]